MPTDDNVVELPVRPTRVIAENPWRDRVLSLESEVLELRLVIAEQAIRLLARDGAIGDPSVI